MISNTKYNYAGILLLISIIMLRIIPHPANCMPIFALLNVLHHCVKPAKKHLIIFTLIALLISDYILMFIYGYPMLGKYSLFTYSGFGLVILLQLGFTNIQLGLLLNTMQTTLIYWLWTNFGVWLLDAMYPLTMQGIVSCYALALPFLKYSLLANIFGVVMFIALRLFNKYSLLRGLNTSKSNSINNIIH